MSIILFIAAIAVGILVQLEFYGCAAGATVGVILAALLDINNNISKNRKP